MTRMLEIVGTGVRREIVRCGQCLVYDEEHLVCRMKPEDVEYSLLMDDVVPPPWCPIPETNLPDEPADESDALWQALRRAEQAFEKSLDENNLDPVYFAHRFTGMILSIDFATITETITVDDLERRLSRSGKEQ